MESRCAAGNSSLRPQSTCKSIGNGAFASMAYAALQPHSVKQFLNKYKAHLSPAQVNIRLKAMRRRHFCETAEISSKNGIMDRRGVEFLQDFTFPHPLCPPPTLDGSTGPTTHRGGIPPSSINSHL